MIFYLSLGSNLAPEKNIGLALYELCERYQTALVLPIVHTEPCAIHSTNGFLNSIALIASNESTSELKNWLNQLECAHGRDRTDPNRSAKDRTLDIDILAQQPTLDFSITETFSEPYVQASIVALHAAASNASSNSASKQHNTAAVTLPGTQNTLGNRAATIDFDHASGNILVREDRIDTLLQRFESTFTRQQGFA